MTFNFGEPLVAQEQKLSSDFFQVKFNFEKQLFLFSGFYYMPQKYSSANKTLKRGQTWTAKWNCRSCRQRSDPPTFPGDDASPSKKDSALTEPQRVRASGVRKMRFARTRCHRKSRMRRPKCFAILERSGERKFSGRPRVSVRRSAGDLDTICNCELFTFFTPS